MKKINISDMHRLHLAQLPTPFYRLDNISKKLGKNIYIKRDDLTGIALGGNKARKLEFVLADAIEKGYDTIITTGGAQSNHATITAACCRRLGLDVILVLQKRGVTDKKGNLLLDSIMNIDVRFVDTDDFDDVYAEIDRLVEELESKGKRPYVIPIGASMPLGCFGYIDCMYETFEQAEAMGVRIDHVVCCTGSSGTHTGALLGTKMCRAEAKVTGIMVSDEFDEETVYKLFKETDKEYFGGRAEILRSDIVAKDYIGQGYAVPSEAGKNAIAFMAENEGIFLDPVYTGKTFAGLMDLCEKGYFKDDENIVFLHTGGAAALFAIECGF